MDRIIFIDGLNRGEFSLSYIGYLFPIATELEENDYRFKILNIKTLPEYSLDALVNQLGGLEFRSIGITTNSENIASVYRVCEKIKQSYPNIPIILGGPQVTFSDVETLKGCNCDIIIRHMGEKSIIQVLDYISGKRGDLSEVKGITYKKDGKIKRNDSDLSLDINSFSAPRFEILNEEKYWIIPIVGRYKQFSQFLKEVTEEYSFFLTGRGCPFSCAFCVEGNIKNKYIFRSPQNVKLDLKRFLSVTKAKYVVIADDTFTSSPKRVSELCEIIQQVQKEEYFFYWFAEGRVDVLSRHPEMIKVMYDAGLRKLQLGLESGRQETLDVYNKRITLEQIEKVIIETNKYKDLTVHGNIMMANPQESFGDFVTTLDFFKRLMLLSNFKLDVGITYLAPFVGTPIRLEPEKYGIELLIDDFEFNSSAMEHVVCKSKKMSLSEVFALRVFTYTNLMSFAKKKLFMLPKEEILSIYKVLKLSNSGLVIVGGLLKQLPSFRKYFKMALAKATVDVDSISMYVNYCPLRLWDLEYLKESNCYHFISLDNEKIILANIEIKLWELASGKNTIFEIFKLVNNKKELVIEMSYIITFYRKLENKLALVFRKY